MTIHSATDHGFTTLPADRCVRKGDLFRLPSAEGLTYPLVPYEMRVLREHRDYGYWEVVFESGGHPARHRSITVMSESDIRKHRDAA